MSDLFPIDRAQLYAMAANGELSGTAIDPNYIRPHSEMEEYLRIRRPFEESLRIEEERRRKWREQRAREEYLYQFRSLVDRLRDECVMELDHPELLEEAATEIERLSALIAAPIKSVEPPLYCVRHDNLHDGVCRACKP